MRHDARDVLRLAQPFEPRKLFGVAPSTDCRTGARTVSGTIADGGPDKRCYRVTCEKIKRQLPGFRPQWTARKGAQELFDAYRAAGLTREEVESGRYFRIVNIQRLLKSGQLDKSLQWTADRDLAPAGAR